MTINKGNIVNFYELEEEWQKEAKGNKLDEYQEESICIIDWCGGYKYCGFWADYFPNENKVKFGGEWYDVPDMIIEHQPTQKECNEWAEKHTKFEF